MPATPKRPSRLHTPTGCLPADPAPAQNDGEEPHPENPANDHPTILHARPEPQHSSIVAVMWKNGCRYGLLKSILCSIHMWRGLTFWSAAAARGSGRGSEGIRVWCCLQLVGFGLRQFRTGFSRQIAGAPAPRLIRRLRPYKRAYRIGATPYAFAALPCLRKSAASTARPVLAPFSLTASASVHRVARQQCLEATAAGPPEGDPYPGGAMGIGVRRFSKTEFESRSLCRSTGGRRQASFVPLPRTPVLTARRKPAYYRTANADNFRMGILLPAGLRSESSVDPGRSALSARSCSECGCREALPITPEHAVLPIRLRPRARTALPVPSPAELRVPAVASCSRHPLHTAPVCAGNSHGS